MKKTFIGITPSFSNISGRFFLNEEYVKAIKKAGGIPVIIPYLKNDIEEIVSRINGVLLSGGGDVLPKFFKEEPELTKLTLPERDVFEIKLIRECFKRKIPVFGICRGCQVMNVAMGGSLIQDIKGKIEHYQSAPANEPTHTIIIEKGSILYEVFKKEKIMVNSFHHQAIKKVGKNLFVSAKAKDGIIEAIESKEHPFFLGVQFHIEYLTQNNKRFLNLFKFFISKAKEI
ncbi:MAG: gamma-glutamyl-gamma-aminobutyrate hydrolase family protein [candidate division WOR-3 bacterium]